MTANGASRPLARTQAKVSWPNRHRPFDPGRGNGSSCPFAVVRAGTFAADATRLQLHAAAHNLGNLMRKLAMPKAAEPWSLTRRRG